MTKANSKNTDRKAILALMRKIVPSMSHLSVDDGITLLCALLAQEICTLPSHARGEELARVIDELPDILRSTEAGMRLALIKNARNGT